MQSQKDGNTTLNSDFITVYVQYSTVQYSAVQYSTVQYSTVQYSTVQYSTVRTIVAVRPLGATVYTKYVDPAQKTANVVPRSISAGIAWKRR